MEVRRETDVSRWETLCSRAELATPFHRAGPLDVIAAESNQDLALLVGYKGEEPVGFFPVFTRSVGPFTGAFSPPPNLKVPYLGPVLVDADMKPRTLETRNSRFLTAVHAWLKRERDIDYFTVSSTPGYEDVRPFRWNDHSLSPRFTYLVDLSGSSEALLKRFSSDARRNVTREYDLDYTIEVGTSQDIQRILELVVARHQEQGIAYPLRSEFVTELTAALPDEVAYPLVCRVNDRLVGGQVMLESDTRSIAWLGGFDTTFDLPVSDLLDWHHMKDASERGLDAYDFAGANKASLSKYKSKFSPTLVSYYRTERGSVGMKAASRLYQLI